MAQKKVKQLVRIFEDGTAEVLEGRSLKNFLAQEKTALTLLITHSMVGSKGGVVKWIPLKEVQITK